jgi:hypothetical protein
VRKPNQFPPSFIPNHERQLGRLLADTNGEAFSPLRTLEEVRSGFDGYVILQGDGGGQVYVVAPAHAVMCSIHTLRRLLREIDELEWPGNDEKSRALYFERMRPGTGVAGGMGGGLAGQEPWLHERLVSQGLHGPIRNVLAGRLASIR